MPSRSFDARDAGCISVFVFIFSITIAIVGPHGDFPLNDDWSFALTLKTLVFQHDWHPIGWASMSLISQSIWAAPACLSTDCSFDVLRATTILACLVLGVATYLTCRLVVSFRSLALLVTVATVFNPIIYALTYTFMTDVLFEMLLVVSAFFYVRALQHGRDRDIILATLLTIAATLCRQLGLCLPIAFFIVHGLTGAAAPRERIFKSMAPLLISGLTYAAYDLWMRHSGRAPALYDQKTFIVLGEFRSPLHALAKVGYHVFESLMYLGLFCLPVTLALSGSVMAQVRQRRPWLTFFWAGLTLACLGAFALILKGKLMPLGGNVLSPRGIGPVTLKDAYFLLTNSFPALPRSFWSGVTLLSAIGAWLLVFLFARTAFELKSFPRLRGVPADLRVSAFAFLAVAANLAPLMPSSWLDRYPAVLVPFLGLGLLPLAKRAGPQAPVISYGAACTAATCLAVFSVLATHDYLSWNRARWDAIAEVERSGQADARTMDGGLEYNGYRVYDPAYVEHPGKSRWWVIDDRIQITFGPLPGMEVLGRYPFTTYLPPARRDIFVLAR